MGTAYKGKNYEKQSLEAFIALHRASRSVMGALLRKKAFGELTPSQFGVLEALYHLGPLSQRKLLTSSGNLVTVIDNLETRGLVKRVRSTLDRRVTQVELTAQGHQWIAGRFPGHVRDLVEVLSVLDGEEQRELKRLCKALGTGQEAGDG